MSFEGCVKWWILSNFDFQIYAGLNIFFGMASIGLLTVVAVDRYLTICRPDAGTALFSAFSMNPLFFLPKYHSTRVHFKI